MAPPRVGTLELLKRKGRLVYHTRTTVTNADGSTSRPLYCLNTEDKATAERRRDKLMRDLAAGRTEAQALTHASAPDTVQGYAESLGSRLSTDDQANLRRHVFAVLGPMALDEVRTIHVKNVRDKVINSNARRYDGRRKEGAPKDLGHKVRRATVSKALGAIKRLFAAAVEDELIEQNPASDVRIPKLRGADREIVKPRTVLTDDELVKYLACEAANEELRMLSLVARCEGGMRTGDLHDWDWQMIDRETFASCAVPRSKTAAPDILEVPEILRPILRAWWEKAGCPLAGLVFPTRKGARAGQRRRPKASHAKALRRDLAKAGVFRLPPLEVQKTVPGTRTDRGRENLRTVYEPNPLDPIYFETATSRPVDFHSWRRAYNTALADADVNVQRAMRLAGHSQVSTHMRYVAQSKAMQTIPEAALPRLGPVAIRGKSRKRPRNQESATEDDDGAKGLKTSVFSSLGLASKPLVRGSSPFGRARETRQNPADRFTNEDHLPQPVANQPAAEGRAPTAREALAVTLAGQVSELVRAGDIEAARVANDALTRLLGTSTTAPDVIDLAEERRRRDGGEGKA